MANPDSVGQNTPDSFGSYAIASAQGVSLATTGNAVVALPILKGGLTAGNSVAASGAVIVRRVTIQNPSANVGTGNITILSSNDGNTSNAVVAAVTLSSLTGTGTFQDVAISGGNVIVSENRPSLPNASTSRSGGKQPSHLVCWISCINWQLCLLKHLHLQSRNWWSARNNLSSLPLG